MVGTRAVLAAIALIKLLLLLYIIIIDIILFEGVEGAKPRAGRGRAYLGLRG